MLDIQDKEVRKYLFEGMFGLEKEGLRITGDGRFAHTAHPFSPEEGVVRDFSENQTEINTRPCHSPKEAMQELELLTTNLYKRLGSLKEVEYLWPYSNPPYIENEEDIPIAQFQGREAEKTRYREYLSHRYGRYKMSFCGIHVNYSFGENLMRAAAKAARREDERQYKDEFYLDLAKKTAVYGWLITALTAASPVMDGSFVEKKVKGKSLFMGMSSVRCSELGYWNFFTPIFDYSSLEHYGESMKKYLDLGLIKYMSELYYPIRLKPPGDNSLEGLMKEGISHIELRMVDVNPLVYSGLEEKDLEFIQLFLIYLACQEEIHLEQKDQVQAAQNFKNAAHYDLKTVNIVLPKEEPKAVADAGYEILLKMQEFFKDEKSRVKEVLEFEMDKFIHPETRYAWQLFEPLQQGYEKSGISLAKDRLSEALRR